MPFQSEAQRRYLWANEPEIARDWTDTYGSRIEKNDGGISQLVRSGPGRPGYAGPAGGASAGGDYGGDVNPNQEYAGRAYRDQSYASKESIEKGDKKLADAKAIAILAADKKEQKVEQFRNQQGLFKNKRTRDFFLDKVLSSNQNYMNTFYGLSDEDQEKMYQQYLTQRTGGEIDAYGRRIDPTGGGGGSYYPRDVHPGTEVTDVTEIIEEETPSRNFEMGGELPYADYGTAAHGLRHNVDRRMFEAHGGRIGRAYGGIMDTATGRRGYFLGSIGKAFGSIAKAAKKVFKSDLGKAALLGAGIFGLPAMGPFPGFSGLRGALPTSWKNKLFMKHLGKKDGVDLGYKGLDWGKAAVWGAPLLAATDLGKVPDDKGEAFDYMGAKNAYEKELLRLKKEANERSLDPNEWNYLGVPEGELPFKDGGRIGLYAGGQSTPSDYTMEDAMMTTTQDKLGGITDVMKQADLYRQGSVGQFYAENGGPAKIGADNVSDVLARVQELQDEGLDFNAAMAQAMKELSQGKAQGGRIGAQEGGLMDLGGMEKDYRNDGGFVPLGGEEKADDVPARLSKNEFVFTADAVRGAGDGDIDKGAEIMENIMKNLEQGGQISEETQGLSGAQEMFGVSERLSEVV